MDAGELQRVGPSLGGRRVGSSQERCGPGQCVGVGEAEDTQGAAAGAAEREWACGVCLSGPREGAAVEVDISGGDVKRGDESVAGRAL
jgi:hypothetical protein